LYSYSATNNPTHNTTKFSALWTALQATCWAAVYSTIEQTFKAAYQTTFDTAKQSTLQDAKQATDAATFDLAHRSAV